MLRCHATLPAAAWPHASAEDHVRLDLDARRRRRQTLTTAGGLQVHLDLADVPALKDGDGLVLDDGRRIRVDAAAEPLIEVSVARYDALPRIAWHLGNRHLPVQFVGGAIRLRPDHVIQDMLRRLGATVCRIEAPFEPEGGAYGHGHTHGHAHGHD